MTRNNPASRWIGVAVIAAGAMAAGCQDDRPSADAKPLPPGEVRLDREPIAVDPDWRRFALDNYRGVLLADLKAASDVRFVASPTVVASRNRRSSDVELSVTGELEANNVTRNRFRRPFIVLWRQTAGGWDLLMSRVDRGELAPEPPPAPSTTRPSTRPAITDPTATPADGIPVVPNTTNP